MAGIGSAGIAGGCNLHAHVAAESGEEAAGHEGEGHEPGQEAQTRHYAEDNKHTCEENDDYGVLPVQVCICAGTDKGRNLFHKIGALILGQRPLCHAHGKQERANGSQCSKDYE